MKYQPTLHKLSNGVAVILDPMDMETAVVSVCFKTGSRDEQPHELGITHFCEHMLCKGTERFPTKKAIEEHLELYGGSRNASTGISSVSFRGKILAANINELIDVLGEEINHSLLLPEKIEMERHVVLDELRRAMDDPSEQLWHFISQKLFGGGIVCYDTLGTIETISSFTREQIIDFINRRFSANNCIICISGKIIDQVDVLACLERNFGTLKQFEVPMNTNISYTPTVAHNLVSDKCNVKLRIIFPELWEPSYEKLYEQQCVGKFEHFLNKKIFDVVRYEKGLVYGFYGISMGNEKHSWNGFSTETSKDNLESVVALIAKTAFNFYKDVPITEQDLYRLHCKSQLSNADWLESSSARCRTLKAFYYDYHKLYDFEKYKRMAEQVTVQDVIKYTRGYFDGPVSIITQGTDIDVDLGKVWKDNFK